MISASLQACGVGFPFAMLTFDLPQHRHDLLWLVPLYRHDQLFLQVDFLSFHLVQKSPVTSGNGSEHQDLLLLEEVPNGTPSHLVERHCGL